MLTFIIAVAVLLIGFAIYGKYVAKVFGPDDRETPAVAINDGVDFVPMKGWRIFLIQLLNIAGLGPIFGALNGALFGPIVYLWIVFGTIFAGAVHDYFSGMISMRHKGASISEITGIYLGKTMLTVMRVFSVILLVMVGVVFSKGPAGLLAMLTPENLDANFWLWVIIIYYFIATFVPIDAVIGKIYPLFGFCLLFMAFGVAGVLLFSGDYQMPELWNNFGNFHAKGTNVWPFMFLTVACGAISGFHATQSPMMARCCTSEKQGHKIFYGAMVAEGIIALVWAAAGVSFYEDSQALLEAGAGVNAVVFEICNTTMGKIGGILAMLGVIACPISSGDTAFRSARLTVADALKLDQKSIKNRILLTVPLLGLGVLVSQLDYTAIWNYFASTNQILAAIVLWTAAFYLRHEGKKDLLCSIPAAWMTAVTLSFVFSSNLYLGGISFLPPIAVPLGVGTAVVLFVLYTLKAPKGAKAAK